MKNEHIPFSKCLAKKYVDGICNTSVQLILYYLYISMWTLKISWANKVDQN